MSLRFQFVATENNVIQRFHKKGHSFRKIAKKLRRSHTVVRNFLNKLPKYGLVKRSGRIIFVSEPEKPNILRKSSNTRISSVKIIHKLCVKMSSFTIDRVKRSANYLKYKEEQTYTVLKPMHTVE